MAENFLLVWSTAILCFFSGGVAGQDLIPYRKGNLWGYSDTTGRMMIEPRYERAWFFSSDGLARVKVRGLFGYTDTSGKLVVPPRFTRAEDFYMGTAAVEQGSKKFCINLAGDPDECPAPEEEIEYADAPEEPFTLARDSLGFITLIINMTGDSVREKFEHVVLKETELHSTRNYFALVARNNQWGAYSQEGNLVVPVSFDSVTILDVNSFKIMKDNLWGVINPRSEMTLPFRYDSLSKVSNVEFIEDRIRHTEFYIVSKNGKSGLLDGAGNEILPLQYDAVIAAPPCNCEQDFIVRKGSSSGIADPSGKLILPPKYMMVQPFNGALWALVRDHKGREGYVGRDGREFFTD